MKKVFTLFLALICMGVAKAQFCEPSETCFEPQLFCGAFLEGYSGMTMPPGQTPIPIPTFCGTVDNPQWFGFVPCEPTVSFLIEAGNCLFPPPQNGLQAAILQVDDCGGALVLNCNEQIFPNTVGQTTVSGLEPGQVYFLLIDGYTGDMCEYSITVEQGLNVTVPNYEQTEPGYIDGPTNIPCTGGLFNYTAVLPICEAQVSLTCSTPLPVDDCLIFEWDLPTGAVIVGDENTQTIQVDMTNAVSGEISVEIDWDETACGDASCYCETCDADPIPPLPIIVEPIVTNTLPALTFCEGEEFDFCGEINIATSNETLSCAVGCEITFQPIEVNPSPEVEIIQTGDLENNPFVLLENEFFETGAPESYFWEGPDIGVGTASDFTQEVTQTGVYTLTVTNTNSGCSAQAQTVVLPGPACPDLNSPVPPADDCSDAPPFCEGYLNGYCSVNAFYTSSAPGNLQSLLSCTIENNQWLSFVACEPTVNLNIEVSNCLGAEGLEFFVLQSNDCQSFDTLSNCVSTPMGDTAMIEMIDLFPGERYLLMVDGINGDICQWNVVSTMGVSDGGLSQEDNTPGEVIGPDDVCLENPVTLTFSFTMPICNIIDLGGCPSAGQQVCEPHLDTCIFQQYDTVWHVDPPGIGNAPNGYSGGTFELVLHPDSIDIPPGQQFIEIEVSVDPFHLVNTGADTITCWDDCLIGCGTLLPDPEGDECIVKPKKFIVCKPDVEEHFFTICPGECIDFMGQTFCGPGVYVIEEEDPCGCTDQFIVQIDELFPPEPIIGPAQAECASDGLTYIVSFPLAGNFNNSFFVNGNQVPMGVFTSNPIPTGEPYSFDVEAVEFECGFVFFQNFSGVEDCPCASQTIEQGLITLCPGDCYDLAGNVYCDPGQYEELIFNPMTGCDDLYLFELENIDEADLATGPVTELCNVLNKEYTVTFSITDGVEPYFVNGNAVGGSLYMSDPIPSGEPYDFQVTDSGQCGNDEIFISGTYTCACVTDPGTVASALLEECEDNMVSAVWNNDAMLDGDDILVFILHTNAGASLGDVLGTNVTGTFGFDPGSMEYGQTYYISAVAGNDAGGNVDLSDACLGVSPGQPVVFYEIPAVDILGGGTLTCDLNPVPLDAFPTGGSGQYSFEWTGPGLSTSGQSVSASVGGTYTCVVIDQVSGCSSESSIFVDENTEEPQFQIVPPNGVLTCEVTELGIATTSAQTDLTYEWTTPSGNTDTGPAIMASEAGVYTVIATAPNGCTAEETTAVNMDISPPENVAATSAELTCDEPSANLIATSSTPGVEFTWIFPSGNEVTGPNITTDVDGQYTVIATGQNGCTSQTTTNVFDLTEPPENVAATSGEINCDEPTATLTASSSTPGVSFTWILPNGDEMMGDEITTDLPGGYTLIATGANGCTAEATSNVVDLSDPPENVTASDGEINCLQTTDVLEATSTTLGVIFTWIFPSGNETEGATISTDETGEYTLIATAPNGCTQSVTAELIDNSDPPEVTATDGEVGCAQPEVTLFVGSDLPGSIFTWTLPNGSNADGASLNTSLSGEYTVNVLAPNGCEATVVTTVTELPDPDLIPTVQINSPSCFGDADGGFVVTSTSGGSGPYTLEVDGENLEDGVFADAPAGEYLLIVTDANGCTDEALVEVPEPALLEIDLGEDLYIQTGEEVELSLNSTNTFASIDWSGPNGQTWQGVSSVVVRPAENSSYEVVVVDPNGCSDSDQIQVFVEGEGSVYVPNAFSPNGDEVNDVFTIFAGEDVSLVRSFSIFNRWGGKVFHDENFAPHTSDDPPTRGWDGTHKGEPLDPAVFVFVAEVEFLTGEVKMISGEVTLVK